MEIAIDQKIPVDKLKNGLRNSYGTCIANSRAQSIGYKYEGCATKVCAEGVRGKKERVGR